MPTLKTLINHEVGRSRLGVLVQRIKLLIQRIKLLVRWGLFRSAGYQRATTMVLDGDFQIAGLQTFLHRAFNAANKRFNNLPRWILRIDGMSGRRYRSFINALIGQIPAPIYLEIGSWAGSTVCAAIAHNPKAKAICIDDWSQFGGPKDAFLSNTKRASGENGGSVRLLESDFRLVDFENLDPKANVFLFDGPHSENDQAEGISFSLPALQHRFVLIVDDFNWRDVREGTFRALREENLEVICSITIRTDSHGQSPEVLFEQSDWHNGYFFAVISQPVDSRSRGIPQS